MTPTADTPENRAGGPGLRERKKQRTRLAIQQAALELITTQGYQATTCEQIAAAAEVSPATFFRYFPSKEDVVLQDDYDPMIALAVADRPARERPFAAVRQALLATLGQIPEEEMETARQRTRLLLSVPSLRARVHEQTNSAATALTGVLASRMGLPVDDLTVQAIASACTGALSVGVERWARDGGPLGPHIDTALAALERG